MEAFETLSGKAVPLDIINVDTDQIIPKQLEYCYKFYSDKSVFD